MRLNKKVEDILYNYENIKVEIENIKIEIEDIKSDYGEITADSYKEKTGSTNKFNSTIENEIIKKDCLIKKLTYELNKKERLIGKIDNALNILSDTEKKIIQYKCFKKLQYKQISSLLNLDYNYACEVKRKAIEKITPYIYIKELVKVDEKEN